MKRTRPDEGETIADLIMGEIVRSSSHSKWGGAVATAGKPSLNPDFFSYRFPADIAAKADVQIIGRAYGCHTCLTKLATDRDQPWIGDHCPPTGLGPKARELLNCDDDTYLFPQCHNCSQQQSSLVSAFSKCTRTSEIQELIDDLEPYGLDLMNGTKTAVPKGSKNWNCLEASGPKVKVAEGFDIQVLGSTPGKRGGCHTCGSNVPVTEYIADHLVPATFVTSSMKTLFEKLDIEYPPLQLRPQCTRCSTSQGGQVQAVVSKATAYGKSIGIVFY
jgi:hypothetical protein